MFLSSLELTSEQIARKEEEFQQLLLDVAEADKTYEELRDFFANTTPSDIKKYWYSYWRWYVWLTWIRLNSLPKDELISAVFSQQVPMALLLDFDVWKSLMWYFVANDFFEDDLESFYLKVKKAFLESEAVVGEWQGKNVTMAELVKEIDSVYGKEDSLAQADFESKLRQIMFPDDEMSKKYFIADPEITKERFLYIVAFFETFTEEKIWFVVDAFLNPGKYQNVAPGQSAPSAPPKSVPTPRPTTPPQPAPKQEAKPRTEPQSAMPSIEATASSTRGSGTGEPKLVVPAIIRPKPSPAQTPVVEPQVRLTTGQVKYQIESEFKKDAEGNFADIEGVMAKLGELADKNNDPKIAEMIYFDEKESKFKWNT